MFNWLRVKFNLYNQEVLMGKRGGGYYILMYSNCRTYKSLDEEGRIRPETSKENYIKA